MVGDASHDEAHALGVEGVFTWREAFMVVDIGDAPAVVFSFENDVAYYFAFLGASTVASCVRDAHDGAGVFWFGGLEVGDPELCGGGESVERWAESSSSIPSSQVPAKILLDSFGVVIPVDRHC